MPQIIVTTGNEDQETVTLRERVNASDFESERFAVNLVERLGWAVDDATEAEHERNSAEDEVSDEPEERPERSRPITGQRRRTEERDPHLEPVGSA